MFFLLIEYIWYHSIREKRLEMLSRFCVPFWSAVERNRNIQRDFSLRGHLPYAESNNLPRDLTVAYHFT